MPLVRPYTGWIVQLDYISFAWRTHFDTSAIDKITTDNTVLVYTEKCAESLDGGTIMRNGDLQTIEGINVEAVPAYNIVNKRSNGDPYHPIGVGNGYIFTFGDKRLYVAGDTENTPEMKALTDIYAAFLPMNLPYTMTPEMVADAALTFLPKVLYPYHYGDTDTNELLNIFDSLKIDSKEAYVDAGSTTVSDNNNMVYDQIVITQGVYHEFGDGIANLRSGIGIVDFDTAMENEGFDFDTIKDLVSDHRPIWAKFRIDLGDDDGSGLSPPININIEDVPNDNGHSLKLTWIPSFDEENGSVLWYRIFRSRSDQLTDPIPLTQFDHIDSLKVWVVVLMKQITLSKLKMHIRLSMFP